MEKESILQTYLKDGLYQSSLRHHGFYLRFIRRIGFIPFYIFYKLGLSANTATFVGFLLELTGVYLFLTSHYFIAAFLIWLGMVFDFFDGVLARTRKEVGTLNTALLCSSHHFLTPTLVLVAGFLNYFFFIQSFLGVLLLALIVGLSSSMGFQLMSIRGRSLFKYYHSHAVKHEEVLQDRTKKNIFMKLLLSVAKFVEVILNHQYIMILLYVFEPLLYIGIFSILMPLRLVGFYTFFYFTNRRLEKKLIKHKSKLG